MSGNSSVIEPLTIVAFEEQAWYVHVVNIQWLNVPHYAGTSSFSPTRHISKGN